MARARRILFLTIFSGTALSLSQGQISEPNPFPENLVEWKLRHFSPEELADGTSDDTTVAAPSGVPNLLRYALGFGPREPIPDLISIQPAGDRLEVVVCAALDRPDVACRLEGSVDLDSWNPLEPDLIPQSSQSTIPGTSLVRSAHEGESRFFRLRVDRMIDDGDEDGLNDDLELAWFASVAHAPSDDPDQDGISTEDELAIGRSPHRGVLSDPLVAQTATGLTILTPLE